MINLEIFDVPVEAQVDEQWYYHQFFWRCESLFGGKYLEVKTHEYQRRLGHELGEWIHDLRELDFDELHNEILKDLPDRVCPHKQNLLKPLISLFLKRFFF
jgi:hypothetical protein